MDLYQGAVVPANQQHDFSPGIPPSGLFWTQPIAPDALTVRLGDGTATLQVRNLPEEDAHTVQNALTGGPTVPATVSFDMLWSALGPPMHLTDPVHQFTGMFQLSTVTIEWSAQEAGFEFHSDPAQTSVNVRSVLGRERNGVFF
jgi:hypothetical protein